ncbi:MAG: cytochrome c, partial [Proteobacteria bacterium]|nr:cytochrome c [Pseudomonadota bacterium]
MGLISPQSTLLLAALCGGICLPALASPQHYADVEFKKNGRIVKTVPVQDLSMSVAAISVSVFEVHEKKNRTYMAYPVRELFNKVFGAGWESSREILFTSTDGYRASIPVAKFVAYDAYLAVAQDGLPFTMVNTLQNNELVELGPLYLVWDNIKSRVLRDEGASDLP